MTHFNRPKYKYQQESFMKDKKTCFTKLNEKKSQIKTCFGNILNHILVIRVQTQKITLFEKDMIITDEKKIANLIRDYFVNIT